MAVGTGPPGHPQGPRHPPSGRHHHSPPATLSLCRSRASRRCPRLLPISAASRHALVPWETVRNGASRHIPRHILREKEGPCAACTAGALCQRLRTPGPWAPAYGGPRGGGTGARSEAAHPGTRARAGQRPHRQRPLHRQPTAQREPGCPAAGLRLVPPAAPLRACRVSPELCLPSSATPQSAGGALGAAGHRGAQGAGTTQRRAARPIPAWPPPRPPAPAVPGSLPPSSSGPATRPASSC